MPGTPGRLTPDRFGFSMPPSDPPFDKPPYYYRGIEMMGVRLRDGRRGGRGDRARRAW